MLDKTQVNLHYGFSLGPYSSSCSCSFAGSGGYIDGQPDFRRCGGCGWLLQSAVSGDDDPVHDGCQRCRHSHCPEDRFASDGRRSNDRHHGGECHHNHRIGVRRNIVCDAGGYRFDPPAAGASASASRNVYFHCRRRDGADCHDGYDEHRHPEYRQHACADVCSDRNEYHSRYYELWVYFRRFRVPAVGLTGVAISTVVSRSLAVLLLLYIFLRSFEYRIKWKEFRVFNRPLFGEILRIGWPLGINMSCWVFTRLIIYSFIATLGAELAKTYVYEYPGILLFLAGLIDRDGRPDSDCASVRRGPDQGGLSGAYRALGIGAVYVVVNAFLLYVFGKHLLGLFTDDKTIIAIGASLLGMNLILQPGKMLNMALGNSLNAVGDTRFTMYISLGSMWLVATVLSYVLGIHMGWGLSAYTPA